MTGSTAASAAPGPSAVPNRRTTPATPLAPATPPAPATLGTDRPPSAAEGAPPPSPPDAVPTTVEEIPAGFWDDDGPSAVAPASADRRDADAEEAPSTQRASALASLQGMALLQAVFPGRVTKVERSATADDDAAPDEAAVPAPIDDDPDPGADAPLPHTP